MVFKRVARGLGVIAGKILHSGWHGFWKLMFYLCVALCFFIGIILAFLGNVIVLLLGFILTLCLYFLKAFAWLTKNLMITTKIASEKVGAFTDYFFEGMTSVLKQEREYLEREINLVIHTENL